MSSIFAYQTPSKPRQPTHRVEESSQPWTTARCHRLLRPLVSRIASLRRESVIAAQNSSSTTTSAISLTNNSSQRLEESTGWLMPKKKRPRLTYAQRRGTSQPQSLSDSRGQQGSKSSSGYTGFDTDLGSRRHVKKKSYKTFQPESQRRAAAPGEFIAPTPLLQRTRGRPLVAQTLALQKSDADSCQGDVEQKKSRAVPTTHRSLDERLASLREDRPHTFSDLEAIFRSLEVLLKATTSAKGPGSGFARGPRSLLEMCLRRIPQYIHDLEAWERLEAEKSGTISTLYEVDTSAYIYEHLESMGANVGWRHLRAVVRADGVNAIREAMLEGLLDDVFSQLLIDLCIHVGAISEAEDLVTTMIARTYPKPTSPESTFTESASFQPLKYLGNLQGPLSLFRQYTNLLSQGDLPQDWLTTPEFEPIWNMALQDLSSADVSEEVMNFMITSISLLCSRSRQFAGSADLIQLEQGMAKTSQRTLISALSLLVAMSLLSKTEPKSPRSTGTEAQTDIIVSDQLNYIIRASASELEQHRRGRSNQRLDLLYLALFLSSTGAENEATETNVKGVLKRLLLGLNNPSRTKEVRAQEHYDNVAWFIASITRSYSRGSLDTMHNYSCLDALFVRLESLTQQDQEVRGNFLDDLKAAAAFFLAQQTSNVRDLIYAESLNPNTRPSQVATTVRGQKRDGSNMLFTGYRWEETIGEWVTVSPNKEPAPKKRRQLRSSTSMTTGHEEPREDSASLVAYTSSHTSGAEEAAAIDHQGSASKQVFLLHKRHTCDTICHVCMGGNQHQQGPLLRKRPRRLLNDISNTRVASHESHSMSPSQATSEIRSKQSHETVSPYPPGKENEGQEVRLFAKKPRRSAGRSILTSGSSMRGRVTGTCNGSSSKHRQSWHGSYSDDELCGGD